MDQTEKKRLAQLISHYGYWKSASATAKAEMEAAIYDHKNSEIKQVGWRLEWVSAVAAKWLYIEIIAQDFDLFLTCQSLEQIKEKRREWCVYEIELNEKLDTLRDQAA